MLQVRLKRSSKSSCARSQIFSNVTIRRVKTAIFSRFGPIRRPHSVPCSAGSVTSPESSARLLPFRSARSRSQVDRRSFPSLPITRIQNRQRRARANVRRLARFEAATYCGLVCVTKKDAFGNFEGASGGRKRLNEMIPSRGHGGAKPENQRAISYRLPATPGGIETLTILVDVHVGAVPGGQRPTRQSQSRG